MNRISSISFLAAMAASGLASAAPAYTTPVGYTQITLKGASDTSINAPVVNAVNVSSAVTAVSGSTLTVDAALTASQFQYVAGTQPNKYFALVTAGTSAGKFYPISSNTASTITVDALGDNLAAISGQTIKISAFWTLGTLFPAGSGVYATTDIGNIKTRVFFNDLTTAGQNIPRTENYIYFDAAGTVNDGWYDANNLGAGIQNDVIIYPDEFMVVRHPTGTVDTTLTVSGTVFANSLATPIVVSNSSLGQDISVSIPYPVDLTLPETRLFESGVFTATTDIGSIKDRLFVFNNVASGYNKPLATNYIYFDAAGTANDGWYDANNLGAGKVDLIKNIPAGSGLVIRKPSGSTAGTATWVFQSPLQ